MNRTEFAKFFDHTILKPEASVSDIKKLCDEAMKYGFTSVCVNPSYVKTASERLCCSNVKVCTVIGFPLGASTTETKIYETKNAIENGANEIDMVINVGAIKSGNWELVEHDIKSVSEACGEKALLKVIFETCLLSDKEKVEACKVSERAGADFVKTSTGFSTGGATESDIVLMNTNVSENVGIKASGSVRDLDTVIKMINSGATRIGASASVKIMEEFEIRGEKIEFSRV